MQCGACRVRFYRSYHHGFGQAEASYSNGFQPASYKLTSAAFFEYNRFSCFTNVCAAPPSWVHPLTIGAILASGWVKELHATNTRKCCLDRDELLEVPSARCPVCPPASLGAPYGLEASLSQKWSLPHSIPIEVPNPRYDPNKEN